MVAIPDEVFCQNYRKRWQETSNKTRKGHSSDFLIVPFLKCHTVRL